MTTAASITPASSYAHVEKPAAGPAHLRRLPRIRVSMIVSAYLAYGYSPEEMCRQFPHLALSEAYSAMSYYFDHQAQIDAEIEAELKDHEQARASRPPSPFLKRLRELGVR